MGVTLHFQSTGTVPGTGAPVSMVGPSLTIGRGPANDLCLPDPGKVVSKSHCAIEDHGGNIVVIDLSTNGTFLNYAKVPLGPVPTPLNDGDILTLGAYELMVEIVQRRRAAPEDLAPAPVPSRTAQAGDVDDLLGPDGGEDDGFLDDLLGRSAPLRGHAAVSRPELGEDGLLPPLGENDDPLPGMPAEDEGQGASHAAHSDAARDAFRPARSIIPEDWGEDDLLASDAAGENSGRIANKGPNERHGKNSGRSSGDASDDRPGETSGARSGDASAPPAGDDEVLPAGDDDEFLPAGGDEFLPAGGDEFLPAGGDDEVLPAADADDSFAGTGAAPVFIPEDDPLFGGPDPERRAAPRSAAPRSAAPRSAVDRAPAEPTGSAGPGSDPATAAPPPATPPGADAASRAFLRELGAGHLDISDADLPARMEQLGGVLRVMIEGLREVLMTRASLKSEFRIQQTTIRPRGNNPLKFSISPEQAVEAMVKPSSAGYLEAGAAAREALDDIRAHEIATMTAMEAALKGILSQLSPDALEAQMTRRGGLSTLIQGKKARYWDVYETMYARISDQAESDFHDLFGRAFADAYQAQLERLK